MNSRSGLTTEDFAACTGHKPQTLRAALCKQGHWCGVVPTKLPNRRLLWPADAVDRLIKTPSTDTEVA